MILANDANSEKIGIWLQIFRKCWNSSRSQLKGMAGFFYKVSPGQLAKLTSQNDWKYGRSAIGQRFKSYFWHATTVIINAYELRQTTISDKTFNFPERLELLEKVERFPL